MFELEMLYKKYKYNIIKWIKNKIKIFSFFEEFVYLCGCYFFLFSLKYIYNSLGFGCINVSYSNCKLVL